MPRPIFTLGRAMPMARAVTHGRMTLEAYAQLRHNIIM